MTSAQTQIQNDITTEQAAASDINSANNVVSFSVLTATEKQAIHKELATAEGLLVAQIASNKAWLVANPVPVPPPAATFVATVTGPTEVTVTWTNVVPVELGRNGVDSTGGGPWNTGTLINQSASGTFAFELLVPGDTYIFSLTEISGVTLTATAVLPAASVPTPMVTLPWTATLAFDEEWSSTDPTHWANSEWNYNNIVPSSVNVSVDANGLEESLPTTSSGVSIETNPNDGITGFAVSLPYYVEVQANVQAAPNGEPANWNAYWMLDKNDTGYEVDFVETINGGNHAALHWGPAGVNQSPGFLYPGSGTGTHKWGALVTNTLVTFYVDGEEAGTQSWPTAPSNVEMYCIITLGTGNQPWNDPEVVPGKETDHYYRVYTPVA